MVDNSKFSLVPIAHLVIPIGGEYRISWAFTDADTGAPADWDGWTARAQIRATYGGQVLAELTDTGADGTVELDEAGNLTLVIPQDFTATMSPLNNAVGDLYLTNPDGVRTREFEYAVRITQEVTQ